MKSTPPPSEPSVDADSADRLEAVFDDAHGELMGTLYYLTGNVEDARDALQETYLKCWRKRPKIDEVTNLKAWVFRIALNTGRDLRRAAWSRRREAFAEDATMLSTSEHPDAALMRDEQLASVRQALHKLRPEEQEVFLLRQNGGLSYDQIAEATSLPLGTVKTRMRAAITQLRQAVGGQS